MGKEIHAAPSNTGAGASRLPITPPMYALINFLFTLAMRPAAPGGPGRQPMYFSRQPVSRRLLFALALCALPGCGSGGVGGGSTTTTTVARSLTQTFQGQNLALASYTLDAPIDQTKPFTVTVGGVLFAQGKDYFIDSTFPNVVHINNALPSSPQVVIQCITLATTTERFTINATNVTKITLSQPADLTRFISVQLVLNKFESSSSQTLTPQQYTFDANNSAVLRLAQAPTPPATLAVTYVPKTP